MLEKVIYYARNKRGLHIKAGQGTGKTTLLRKVEEITGVYTLPGTKKEIIIALNEFLGLPIKGTITKLLDALLFELDMTNPVLLIDDVHELKKTVTSMLKKLESHGLTLITIGEKNVFNLTEARMPGLTKSEVEVLIPDKELRQAITSECTTPLEITQAVRKAKHTNLSTKEKRHAFISSLAKKHDLLPITSLALIATLLLSLRYYYYMIDAYETGYTLALIGYLLKAIIQKRKSN